MPGAHDTFRQQWVYGWAGAEDASILDRDARRTMHQANNRPAFLAVRAAEGSFVEDHSGRRYLDLHGNNCHHIGYRHPELIAGLIDQLSTLPFNVRGFTNEVFVLLAERLAALWPGNDGRVFLVPGGAAAVELALALARVHTGRYKSISFADSYHGRSLGAIGLTGVERHRSKRLGPLLPGALHVPSFKPVQGPGQAAAADPEAAARSSLDAIRNAMKQEGDVACVIAETIGNGGYRPPDWYWPEVRALCDEHGSLLIFDDIPTGLGKTGALFNSEHFGVTPHMTVLGKALGGTAMPAAAVIADGQLDTAPELNLGYFTHEKNPLMARAGLITLEIIQGQNLTTRARTLGGEILQRLSEIQRRHASMVTGVRGEGLMLSLDLASADDEAPGGSRLAHSIFFRCIENGVILNYPSYGATLTLSFPLNIAREDVDLAIDVLNDALDEQG
jgi:4-aminobutyrate aminotransferase